MQGEYAYADQHADDYARMRGSFTSTDHEVSAVLDSVGLQNLCVLDIGCGDGRHTEWFTARGARTVVGVDNSPRMIARARARASQKHSQFVEASALALPFGEGTFDFAFSYFTLHHVLQAQEALNEVYRVLVPGGAFLAVFGGYLFSEKLTELCGEYGPVELRSGSESIVMQTVIRSTASVYTYFVDAGFKLKEFRSIPNADARMHHSHPYRNNATLATTLAFAEK